MVKNILTMMGLFLFLGHSAFAGSVNYCTCQYEAISGDYALILNKIGFNGAVISSRKVGTYFGERQCEQMANTAYACSTISGGSQYCDCKYDAISGDYQLTRYMADEEGTVLFTQKLFKYHGQSACTSAALNMYACY